MSALICYWEYSLRKIRLATTGGRKFTKVSKKEKSRFCKIKAAVDKSVVREKCADFEKPVQVIDSIWIQ
jgi:hypothetical protein